MLGSAREGLLSPRAATVVVGSCAASTEARFIELYRAEFKYVWKSARRLGVSRAEADDVVQETFVAVHRLLPTYDLTGSPRAWLFSLLFRVVQRHRRSHRRRTAHTDAAADVDVVPGSPARAPDRSAETTEAVTLLEGILEKLDPDKRAVLVLADIEEKPVAEIAEILGINPRTATSRLRLAREYLEASLARHRARDQWRFDVTTESEKKKSPLVLLAGLYDPDSADEARVLEKVRASIDVQASAAAVRSSIDGQATARSAAGAGSRSGMAIKLVGLSCFALALFGSTIAYWDEIGQGSLPDGKGGETRARSAEAEPATALAVTTGERPTKTALVESAGREPANAPTPKTDSPASLGMPSVSVSSVRALPTAPEKATLAAPPPSAVPEAPAPGDTLERESRLLAAARHALRGGDGHRALELLDEHVRTFPNGWFAEDRAAERVVVLCSLGRRDDAAREAKDFLDSHPKSPLTRRIATSCAGRP